MAEVLCYSEGASIGIKRVPIALEDIMRKLTHEVLYDNIQAYYANVDDIVEEARPIYEDFALDICTYLSMNLSKLPRNVQVTPMQGPMGCVMLEDEAGGNLEHTVVGEVITVNTHEDLSIVEFSEANYRRRAELAVDYGRACMTQLYAALHEPRPHMFVHFVPYMLPLIEPDYDRMKVRLHFGQFRSYFPKFVETRKR
jgi:hypothetical protein